MVKIAVVGSIVMDLAIQIKRLPKPGETLLCESYKLGPGGKGANAAVAAARGGADSVLIGCIGDDAFGQMELNSLGQEGVHLDSIVVRPRTCTGLGIAMIDPSGDNTIAVVPGANDYLNPEDIRKGLKSHIDTTNVILVNFEVPEPVVAEVIRLGNSNNIPVIVDAGPARAYHPDTWAGAYILSPNDMETATLVGRPITNDNEARKAARELLDRGPRAVVLHRGDRGALIVTEDKEISIPAFQVSVVDTTGAGDAFAGMLAVSVASGLPLEVAVRRANAAGALAVTRIGTLPIMPTCQEVDAFLDNIDKLN